MRVPLYQALARAVQWHRDTNDTFKDTASARLAALVDELPHGSGIDGETTIDSTSTPDKVKVNIEYHHMNDNGYYDGWTSHTITIKPSLAYGFTLGISGPDRNEIKDYIAQTFDAALREIVEER